MRLTCLALAALALSVAPSVRAEYPHDRPVEVIIPYSAGGVIDVTGRAFVDTFSKKLDQTVVVLNKDGASTVVGMNALAAAPADGYTILFGPVTALTTHVHWMKGLQFNDKSFVPVCQTFENVFTLAVTPQSKFNKLSDVIAQGRARPGSLTYAHPGVSSSPHLTGAEFFQRAKVAATDVPFRGENPMVPSLRDGSVDVAVVTSYFVANQKLKPLVVFANQRYAVFPDVPTAKELGYPVIPSAYGGLFMRADTPVPIVKKVEAACKAAMSEPRYRALAQTNYQVTEYMDSARFAARMREDSLSKAELLKSVKFEK